MPPPPPPHRETMYDMIHTPAPNREASIPRTHSVWRKTMSVTGWHALQVDSQDVEGGEGRISACHLRDLLSCEQKCNNLIKCEILNKLHGNCGNLVVELKDLFTLMQSSRCCYANITGTHTLPQPHRMNGIHLHLPCQWGNIIRNLGSTLQSLNPMLE